MAQHEWKETHMQVRMDLEAQLHSIFLICSRFYLPTRSLNLHSEMSLKERLLTFSVVFHGPDMIDYAKCTSLINNQSSFP